MSTNAFTYTQPLNATPVLVGDAVKDQTCCGEQFVNDDEVCVICFKDAYRNAVEEDEVEIFEDPAFASEEPYKLNDADFYTERKAQSRRFALNLFFNWCETHLEAISRRCASEGYEAYHERRLALGLTEAEAKAEYKEWRRRRAAQRSFDSAMFVHVGDRENPCDDPLCIYCATWADRLRDERQAEAMGA